MTQALPATQTNNNPELTCVNAYLRLPNSHSVKLQLNSCISLPELKTKVFEMLKIPQSVQIIYHKGRELKSSKPIEVKDKSIFHIKDSRDMLEQISIHLIRHDPQKENLFRFNNSFAEVTVNQSETIQSFLERYLNEKQEAFDMKRSRIIECGRFLKLDKTFRESNIEQHAQVHIILKHNAALQAQDQQQQNQQHEKFVKKVLMHSRHNSNTDQQEQTFTEDNVQKSEICIDFQPVEMGKLEEDPSFLDNSVAKETEELSQTKMEKVESTEMFNKTNPELSKSSFNRDRASLLLSHTKSSEKWIREKVPRSNLTPLKLGLREYKKYDGPLSVRACNCKRKPFQSQEHIKLQQSQPCFLHSSRVKSNSSTSQNKLKKSLTMIS